MSSSEIESAEVADAPRKQEYVAPRLTIVPMQHALQGPTAS
jgi:hypothetical protein